MKNILVINPFTSIYPPMNGGMLRGFHLLHQLTRFSRVTVVMNQDKESFLRCVNDYPAFKNCTVISTAGAAAPRDVFSLLPAKISHALRFRAWNRSLKGPAEGNFLTMYPLVKGLLQQQQFDFVLLEEMEALNIGKMIKRMQPQARIIYDAYNVNTRLAASALENNEITQAIFADIELRESTLTGKADAIFACSENDLAQLKKMNKGKLDGVVIPNGVNVPANGLNRQSMPDTNNDILFCSSMDYFPNQEGLLWFRKEVFPLLLQQIPTARLLVVGKGDPGKEIMDLMQHENIVYYGMVDSVADYYRSAALAIVPLLSGSGTRLKLLEAMGYTVPVVATSVGAEGINYTDKKNIVIADEPAAFAAAIGNLLNNREQLQSIAKEGYLFARENYDWNFIGEKMATFIGAV